MKAWVNGNLKDFRDTTVHLLSHSFSRGSAIFEVMEIVHTRNGAAFFCLDQHTERFFSSAEATFMELPLTRQELRDALFLTAKTNEISEGIVKFFAYYPEIELGTLPAKKNIEITIFSLGHEFTGIPKEEFGAPVTAGISSFRKIDPHTTTVHAKVVGNYVNSYLAKNEIRRKRLDEAILLDTSGYIAEAPTSNIFFVQDGTVITPTTESVLPGITRKIIIEVISELGIPFQERHIRPQDIPDFQEAFFSGTLNHVQPIRSIEDTQLTCPGPVTSVIKTHMLRVLAGELERYAPYLTIIS